MLDAAKNRIEFRQLMVKLRKRFASTSMPYFLTGILIILALTLHFYHPADAVDLVISTEQLHFRIDASEAVATELIRAMPVSLLGLQRMNSFEVPVVEAFWPCHCKAPSQGGHMQAMEPGTLLLTPRPVPEAQLLIECSQLQLISVIASEGDEIELGLRDNTSQNQIRLKINGEQPRLGIQMPNDTIYFRSQDYQVYAQQAGRTIELTPEDDILLGFRLVPKQREVLVKGSGVESLIFYDIDLQEMNPATEDLLKVPFRVKHLDFYDLKILIDNPVSMTKVECVSLSIGEEPPKWINRDIYIQKQDLDRFVLNEVQVPQPGRLQVALSGQTDTFRAGVTKELENQIPPALPSLYAKLGLLLGFLLGILNLFFKLKERWAK